MPARADIARAAADALAGASFPAALVGFDGFVDSIVHMVATRHGMGPSGYTRLATIPEFAARCAAAAGRSTNIEQVLIEDRFGGNGPLMAGALGRLGVPTTFIGAVAGEGGVHPVFRPFAARCREVIAVAPPSHTLCMEFDDGKIMLNNTAAVQAVTWPALVAGVGLERLTSIVAGARLIGIVNWSLMGGVPGIWRALRAEVWPRCPRAERRVFIDLSDPAKRSDGDIADALNELRGLEEAPGVAVTLGLNLAEAERVARVVGGAAPRPGPALADTAADLRRRLCLDAVVIHPREGAAGATGAGEGAWFDGPFTPTPRLSTGAGDHFNAGVALGQILGLPLDQCLAAGCAVSGAYVRDALSPDRPRLVEFLRTLPPPAAS